MLVRTEKPSCIPVTALSSIEAVRKFVIDPSRIQRITQKHLYMNRRPTAGPRLAVQAYTETPITSLINKLFQIAIRWISGPLQEFIYMQNHRARLDHIKYAHCFYENYLEESFNGPTRDTASFILQPSTDLRAANNSCSIIAKFPGPLENWQKGICNGMSKHFIILIHHMHTTLKQPITENMLRAIASEFETGGSKETLLLQYLHNEFDPVVGLFSNHTASRQLGDTKFSPLAQLSPGTYLIDTEDHAMALIVTEIPTKKSFYLFDPNTGLSRVTDFGFECNMQCYRNRNSSYTLKNYALDLERPHSCTFNVLKD